MSKENGEVLIDIVAADKIGDTLATLTSCVLAKGLAPKNWRIMWHYTSTPLQVMGHESLEDVFAGHLLLPDVVVMCWPVVPNIDLPVLKEIVEKLKLYFLLVIITDTPKERLAAAEIKDETGITILEAPADPLRVYGAVKSLLEASEKARQPKSDAEIEAELIRQGWSKEIREGCEVFVRPMDPELSSG